jgi:ankyrin repeat protein
LLLKKPSKKLFSPITEMASISDCCVRNDYEELNRQIDNGINFSEKDDDGCTPLHVATYYNSLECMEILIRAGANIDEKNNIGSTALHNASLFGSKDSLQLLMDYGADPNIKNENGITPLFYAAISSNHSKECMEILLKYGAEPTIKNTGKTFLDWIQDGTLRKEIEDYATALSTWDIKEPSC